MDMVQNYQLDFLKWMNMYLMLKEKYLKIMIKKQLKLMLNMKKPLEKFMIMIVIRNQYKELMNV